MAALSTLENIFFYFLEIDSYNPVLHPKLSFLWDSNFDVLLQYSKSLSRLGDFRIESSGKNMSNSPNVHILRIECLFSLFLLTNFFFMQFPSNHCLNFTKRNVVQSRSTARVRAKELFWKVEVLTLQFLISFSSIIHFFWIFFRNIKFPTFRWSSKTTSDKISTIKSRKMTRWVQFLNWKLFLNIFQSLVLIVSVDSDALCTTMILTVSVDGTII